MDDSFLQDLELTPIKPDAGNTLFHAERNITRRRSQPSPRRDEQELNILMTKSTPRRNVKQNVAPAQRATKSSRGGSDESQNRSNVEDTKILEGPKAKVPDRRSKPTENKLKRMENAANRESSRGSDGSSKEGDGVSRKRESTERFDVAMLNSVKEIVGAYTENETIKILRAMQTYYINSQASIVKLILRQTDDIVDEVSAGKESSRMRSLLEENARLKENIAILEARNGESMKIVEESERLRQENLRLKQHCNKLLKSVNSKENCPNVETNEEKRRPSSSSTEKSSNAAAQKLLEIYRNSK